MDPFEQLRHHLLDLEAQERHRALEVRDDLLRAVLIARAATYNHAADLLHQVIYGPPRPDVSRDSRPREQTNE